MCPCSGRGGDCSDEWILGPVRPRSPFPGSSRRSYHPGGTSSQYLVNHVPVDIGESAIDPIVVPRELLVIEA